MNQKPQYIIVGGVNGAGKSNLYLTMPELFENTIRMNADEILRANKGNWRNDKDNASAMKIVVKSMKNALQEKKSFHQETTLAGRGQKKWINEAKNNGFEVTLIYVALSTPELAINRVNDRIKKGGHGVPPETIKKRYVRSLENLDELSPLCDNVLVFDNTTSLTPIFERKGERTIFDNRNKYEWLKPVKEQKSQKVSSFSIENVKKMDQELSKKNNKQTLNRSNDKER